MRLWPFAWLALTGVITAGWPFAIGWTAVEFVRLCSLGDQTEKLSCFHRRAHNDAPQSEANFNRTQHLHSPVASDFRRRCVHQ
jgi:hypothetical protein